MDGSTPPAQGGGTASEVRERIERALEHRDLLGVAHARSLRRREWIPYDVVLDDDFFDDEDFFMTDNEAFSQDEADLQTAIDFSLMPEFVPEYRCDPATEAEISGLGVKPADTESTCVICHEKVLRGDPCFDLACGHDMHEQCMREWFKSGRICPICRAPLFENAA